MSMNGGYVIVDFKGVNLTKEKASVIAGIYESIEASHHKAILVSGVTIDGVEQRDTFINPTVNASNFVFTAYGHTITVSAEDNITIAAA